ncbi:HAD-IIIC family phosphatase [Embleya sp. AB8]|uniref:HAD-IIIC family phosphatase n=1 Tax=Embleya sp. AB8 TaxID=3156304 RepID=UPI003C769220
MTTTHTTPAPAPTGVDELLALHRADRLLADYPRVRELLAEASGDEPARAGLLLSRLDPAAVTAAHPGVRAVSITVTGHGTLSALTGPLTGELARHGLVSRPRLTDFDSYVFELSDPDSELYASRADLVLCVLDAAVVFDEIPVPWTPADVERTLAAKVALIEQLAARYADLGTGTLVLNTLPLPRAYTAQLVDHRSRARLGGLWREANARLLRIGEAHASVLVLDLDPLLADGIPATEARLNVYAKAHLSAELLAGYAREVAHLARNLVGRTRKVLVLDLDNTLWGGVLGDDGIEGIEIGSGYRGEAFTAFQRVVKQLGAQGILLAAVSKNDAEPVREALRDHPGMTLREADFVRVVANWAPKHENLAELATALNLGVDSFVFVDDSPYECGLVRRELPEVAVIRLDAEPALHPARLLADGWFDTRELTAEDQARTSRYRDELDRRDFLDSFASLDDYLAELGVTVRIAPAAPADLSRVSQLTLRTNQFNLTTDRLQPAAVQTLAADPNVLVLAIHTADRFGANGLVGAILAHRADDVLHVDNMLLSCRVFARGVEQSALSALLRHARDTGAKAVYGTFRPAAKNGKVRDLYPRYGFTPVPTDTATDTDTELLTFRHDLVDIVTVPTHVALTEIFEGEPEQ